MSENVNPVLYAGTQDVTKSAADAGKRHKVISRFTEKKKKILINLCPSQSEFTLIVKDTRLRTHALSGPPLKSYTYFILQC